MPKLMKSVTVFSFVLTVITCILQHYFDKEICLTLAITFGTIFYHLGSRLLVGVIFNAAMNNHGDYTKKWYKIHAWENKLYKLLGVRKWKNKMPTYYPETFSTEVHTWDEIARAMCQSELVHEVNIIISFVPIIAAKRFGAFYVFFITSVCGAVFDLMFVIMQRYNRDRVLKIALRKSGL